jgi:hypothetical protein
MLGQNMKLPPPAGTDPLGPPPPAYQRLQSQLAQTSWICQGTLVCRPLLRRVAGRLVKKGPYYLWTSKRKAKTVCVALSQAQYRLLARTIANHRRLQKTLEQMHKLTFKTVLQKVPGVARRK